VDSFGDVLACILKPGAWKDPKSGLVWQRQASLAAAMKVDEKRVRELLRVRDWRKDSRDRPPNAEEFVRLCAALQNLESGPPEWREHHQRLLHEAYRRAVTPPIESVFRNHDPIKARLADVVDRITRDRTSQERDDAQIEWARDVKDLVALAYSSGERTSQLAAPIVAYLLNKLDLARTRGLFLDSPHGGSSPDPANDIGRFLSTWDARSSGDPHVVAYRWNMARFELRRAAAAGSARDGKGKRIALARAWQYIQPCTNGENEFRWGMALPLWGVQTEAREVDIVKGRLGHQPIAQSAVAPLRYRSAIACAMAHTLPPDDRRSWYGQVYQSVQIDGQRARDGWRFSSEHHALQGTTLNTVEMYAFCTDAANHGTAATHKQRLHVALDRAERVSADIENRAGVYAHVVDYRLRECAALSIAVQAQLRSLVESRPDRVREGLATAAARCSEQLGGIPFSRPDFLFIDPVYEMMGLTPSTSPDGESSSRSGRQRT
jgi:hypothetical protein